MGSEAPKNIPQTPKQEVISNPIEDLRKLQEAVEAKQPSFAEYTKQKGYTEMKVEDPEAQMAYKVFKKTQERNLPDNYLLDISVLIKDPEGVGQILNQNINVLNENMNLSTHGDFYTIHITYLTKEGLSRSKIIILNDSVYKAPFGNSTPKSKNNLAIRNLTVFKK